MGYRTYIGEMPKKEYNKIKSMDENSLVEFYNIEKEGVNGIDEEGSWYKGVYEYGKSLYEFGKYTGFQPPKKSLKPFFKNKELMGKYDEYDFYIVTPDFLAYIIDNYKSKIQEYYTKMMNPWFDGYNCKSELLNSVKVDYKVYDNDYKFDFSLITQEEQNSFWIIIEHIRSMNTEWNRLTPYDLSNDGITSSWKYEYSIFQLIHIYKTFDWKRKVMIYYGF